MNSFGEHKSTCGLTDRALASPRILSDLGVGREFQGPYPLESIVKVHAICCPSKKEEQKEG